MLNDGKDRIVDFVRVHRKKIQIWVLVLLTGTMLLRGVMQIPRIYAAKAEIARLNEQIEYEKERQKEVGELSERVNSDEYIEKIAGEKLGLVKNNAKIFVDISGE